MKTRNWVACTLLAAAAYGSSHYLGLDVRHAIAITLAAFMAGVAYVLLDSLSGDPGRLEPERVRTPRGLDEVQALAFSLSANGGRTGNRARLLLVKLADRTLRQDGFHPADDDIPDGLGSSLTALLDRRIQETDLPRGTVPAAVRELEAYLSAEHPLQPATEPELT
ncbi:hypothetical protein [Arthrobacter roseus]|uniref:hypothetical protein n=1 Tax=Arthrobacter roseus TaxID=136274 RepID=UPI0019629226|nr:hypothetical protein [Arthrobacter roseus]MBM7849034.1 hypothetical protein [Arthrobacter roseus]